MSESQNALRSVGLKLLQNAVGIRDSAQRRVWEAADAVDECQSALARAEARLATEERSLGANQEILRMIWEDFNPRTGSLYSSSASIEDGAMSARPDEQAAESETETTTGILSTR